MVGISPVPQDEELSTGVGDARNPGDDGNPQPLVTERPLRHAREVFLVHKILVPVYTYTKRPRLSGGGSKGR